MKPYYDHAGITIYHGDCREILPSLGKFDLLLTDPPYGLADHLHRPGPSEWSKLHGQGSPDWDRETSDAVPTLVSAHGSACVWGGNYYALPPSRGWLVWDKMVRQFSSGHCELAWTTLDQPVRAFSFCNGQLANEGKLHPTQKPLTLIKWCVAFFPEAKTVLDPFMGSGTTLRAAKDAGLRAVGIDRVERYCEIAAKRLAQEVLFA